MNENRVKRIHMHIDYNELEVIRNIRKAYINGSIKPQRELKKVDKILKERGVVL